ncbi:MAG TPA: M23 family metallopeptidase, partial [Polyangiaceae bacterium]
VAALAASYNAALSAMAIGAAFFVPGSAALLAAVLAALCAAFASIAISRNDPAFSVLAWPFVVVTLLALRALRLRGSSRAPFESPLPLATPETNRDYSLTLRTRLGFVGKPRLTLPFLGTWFVSQGVDGNFTHRGAWAHALDFEVSDADGFPFREHGRVVDDYYCYGQPALAPGTGTVIAIHDGAPDQAPGHQDTLKPWGNAIVLQHGPELFSVLAHLQPGSMSVKTGDFVVPGQRLGRVGSSGRSPRPHLHLQMQRSAELGAPTLEFDLINYAEQRPDRAVFSAFGVPEEGARLFAVEPAGAGAAILGLTPGAHKACSCDGVPLKLRYELSLHGEHSLVDVDRGDRVYFLPGPVLTTYAGSSSSPLAALYWAIPRLPLPNDMPLTFEERLVPCDSLPALWSGLRFMLALLGMRCELVSRGVVERRHSELTVRTRTELRLWKYSLASWSTTLDVGPEGLLNISRDGRRSREPHRNFRALYRLFARFPLPSKEPNHVPD